MFDLQLHREINRILTFQPPEQQFAKSEHEKLALKRKTHFSVHAMPGALEQPDALLVELHTYVTEKYAAYFGLDIAHKLQRHKDAVYYMP